MKQTAHKTTRQQHTFSWPFSISNFNGKEKDRESGFHYYGARYYWSEVLTGWLSVDPMADKYPFISPYAYCAWNPIIATDPSGMDSVHTPNGMVNVGDGYKATPDGHYLYGEGLQPKRWNPNLETGCIVGDGFRGGYENCDESELPVIHNERNINSANIAVPTGVMLGQFASDVFSTAGDVILTVASYLWIIPACMLLSSDTRQYATDNSNKEKHGDGGKAEIKAKKQVDQLQKQAQNAPRKERERIKNKITNIKRNAAKKEAGEEHSRTNKH